MGSSLSLYIYIYMLKNHSWNWIPGFIYVWNQNWNWNWDFWIFVFGENRLELRGLQAGNFQFLFRFLKTGYDFWNWVCFLKTQTTTFLEELNLEPDSRYCVVWNQNHSTVIHILKLYPEVVPKSKEPPILVCSLYSRALYPTICFPGEKTQFKRVLWEPGGDTWREEDEERCLNL